MREENRKLNHRSVQQLVCDAKWNKTPKDGKQCNNNLDESTSIQGMLQWSARWHFIWKPLSIRCTSTHKTRDKIDARWIIPSVYTNIPCKSSGLWCEIWGSRRGRSRPPAMERLHKFRSWRKLPRHAKTVHATALEGDELPCRDQCLGTAMILSKLNEIVSIIKPFQPPLQICGLQGIQILTCGYSMSHCHQETTRHLPGAVGFPGAVSETHQIKRVCKQCLNLLTELNVLNISNTRMQKSIN